MGQAPDPPLLVIEGRLPGAARWGVALLATLCVLGAVAALTSSPLVRWLHGGGGGPGVALLLLLAIAVGVVLPLIALDRWELRRAARVELYPERVVLLRERSAHGRVELRWDELAGFRDGEAGWVELVARPRATPVLSDLLAIPTPTDEARAALLAALDGRGLPRLE